MSLPLDPVTPYTDQSHTKVFEKSKSLVVFSGTHSSKVHFQQCEHTHTHRHTHTHTHTHTHKYHITITQHNTYRGHVHILHVAIATGVSAWVTVRVTQRITTLEPHRGRRVLGGEWRRRRARTGGGRRRPRVGRHRNHWPTIGRYLCLLVMGRRAVSNRDFDAGEPTSEHVHSLVPMYTDVNR